VITITGGSDVEFSNIAQTFGLPGSKHFGVVPITGVARSVAGKRAAVMSRFTSRVWVRPKAVPRSFYIYSTISAAGGGGILASPGLFRGCGKTPDQARKTCLRG